MENENILRRFRFRYIFTGYIIIINCLSLFQYQGYTLETEANNDHKDCSNSTEITTSTTVKETTTPYSFTEGFIETRAGRYLDFIELLTKYSSVCPIQDTCGVGIDPTILYHGELYQNVTDCSWCTCDRHCSTYGNCCPGSHFGYVDYTCVNTMLYPKEIEMSYYMIASCLESYDDNKTIIELCNEEVAPCTGALSQLVFKNKHCGKCNHESECTTWEISVECGNADRFEKQMQTFSSHLDMRRALNESDCRLKFEPSDFFPGRVCSDPNNDYLSITRVDKCNVSGLWRELNADINWACENFISPYKHFKNVFCYICNPSHANMENVPLIDTCNSSTIISVSKACSTMPESDRFAPYKNVFCYVCNQGYDILYAKTVPFLQNIVEEINLDLQSKLGIYIKFKGDLAFEQFKNFVTELITGNFNILKRDYIPSKTIYIPSDTILYNETDLIEFENVLTSVCGTGILCFRNTTGRTYSNPVCKKCSCESVCAEMESCCPDILLTRRPYSCYSPNLFPTFHQSKIEDVQWERLFKTDDQFTTYSYKTIVKCLNGNVSKDLAEKCEADANNTDRLSLIPVSTEAGLTYRNIYCYACNSNESTISLKFQAVCNSFIEHKLFTKLDNLLDVIKHHCQRISFLPIQNKLCTDTYDVNKAATIQGEKFIRRELHPSQFEFKAETFVELKTPNQKRTDRNVFERCNKTGYYSDTENDITKLICESEDINIMSLLEYRVENTVFKNFACFLCNQKYAASTVYSNNATSLCLSDITTEWYEPDMVLEELCNITEFHPRWYPYKNMYCAQCNLPPWQFVYVHVLESMVLPAAGYKYIFSLSMEAFKHLDEVMETEEIPNCDEGTFDYFLKQCRPLNCFKGLQLTNSTCEPILEYAVRHEYKLSIDLHFHQGNMFELNDGYKTNRTLIFNYEDLSIAIVNDVLLSFDKTTEYFLKQTEYSVSPCESVDNGGAFELENYVDIVKMDTLNIQFTVRILKTENIGMVHTILLQALNRKFDVTDILDIDGVQQNIQLYSTKTKLKEREESSEILFLGCKHVQFFGDPRFDSFEYTHFFVDEFLTCGHVKLNSSKVCKDIETDSISLKDTNESFSDIEYKIIDNYVIICGDLYSERTYIVPRKQMYTRIEAVKSIFIVFSIVCTVISLVCLLFTFITYSFISSLRTVAGKNIMTLCMSLFFSQALLQFGINAKGIHILCVAIGILIHLSWLMSFCAMNVCSFHTFKVFYYNDTNNIHTKKHSKSKLFLKYTVYIICFPVFFVAATISVSFIRSDATDVGYGQLYCFISDFFIFMLTFIAPACCLFISNIVFFSLAFHKIRCTPKANSTRDRNHFFICLKLFTIVGIAWPLLIFDNMFGITWFSFIVAGVNSLQGVFIFVSFVLNRRVASLVLSSVLKKSETRTMSTKTGNTKSSPIIYRGKTDIEINTTI